MLSRALVLLFCVTSLTAQVRVFRNGEQVDVTINGRAFTSLYFGSDAPKPYLHPLRAASGVVVTRSFPMENIPGEDQNEPHHRGLWLTLGDVNGVNFWAEGPGKGRVVLRTLGKLVSGPEVGSLRAEFQWVAPDGNALLDESRYMTFTQIGGERIIEFEATLKPSGGEPVKLGDTKEGFFAIRVVKALQEPSDKCKTECTGVMISSEGGQGEKGIWGKRANWVDYSGTVEGQKWGVAIFDHPKNPKHPTYWHARGYGLFAANPFGEHDFYADKKRDGSLTIQPGSSLTFRYRVIIHPWDLEGAKIPQQYKKWLEKVQ